MIKIIKIPVLLWYWKHSSVKGKSPYISSLGLSQGAFVMHKTMEETKGIYKTSAWLKCRAAYIKSVGGLCERCLARGEIKPGYIVHHKVHLTPWNITDTSITLNWDNLEYLCLIVTTKNTSKRR